MGNPHYNTWGGKNNSWGNKNRKNKESNKKAKMRRWIIEVIDE